MGANGCEDLERQVATTTCGGARWRTAAWRSAIGRSAWEAHCASEGGETCLARNVGALARDTSLQKKHQKQQTERVHNQGCALRVCEARTTWKIKRLRASVIGRSRARGNGSNRVSGLPGWYHHLISGRAAGYASCPRSNTTRPRCGRARKSCGGSQPPPRCRRTHQWA